MPSTLPRTYIRSSAEQKSAWERAAAADGRTLSAWLARVADAAAKKALAKK